MTHSPTEPRAASPLSPSPLTRLRWAGARLLSLGKRASKALAPRATQGFSPDRFFFFRSPNWWAAGHLLSAAGSHMSVSGAVSVERLKWRNFDNLVLRGGRDAVIRLEASGGHLALTFVGHPAAGDVEIVVNGAERRASLAREPEGVVDVRVDGDAQGEIDLELRLHPRSGDRDSRITLLGVEFAVPQTWVMRTQRVGPLCQLTHGVHGSFLTLVTDDTIGAVIGSTGEWAPHDVEVFRRHISPGDTVFDVGANIGHHTVVFSKLVGPEGRVLALEPQGVIYNLLCGNLAINDCQNAEALRVAVGDHHHVTHLYPISYTDSVNFGAIGVSLEGESLRGEPVECWTLDEIVSRALRPYTRVDFAKIDVQSYELFALRGFEQTLARDAPKLFLEISPEWMAKAGYDYNEVYKLLLQHGYRLLDPYSGKDMSAQPRQWSGVAGEEWDILAAPAAARV